MLRGMGKKYEDKDLQKEIFKNNTLIYTLGQYI